MADISAGVFIREVDAEQVASALLLGVRALRRAGEPTPPEMSALLRALLDVIPQQPEVFRAKVSPDAPVFRGASLSVSGAAKRLAISEQAVRGLARRGSLVARRGTRGSWEIDEQSVTEYERGRRNGEAA